VKAYKILTLIGSILGLILAVGALGMVEFLIMGYGLKTDYQFVGLAISTIIVYIVALCVALGTRNTRYGILVVPSLKGIIMKNTFDVLSLCFCPFTTLCNDIFVIL
jgi:uncharacterized membrane protein